MKMKSVLATTLLVLAFGLAANATTLVTPPVQNSSRTLYCIVQNLDITEVTVTTKAIDYFGNTLKTGTYTFQPGEFFAAFALWGQGGWYCTFDFPKGKKVRGYIWATYSGDSDLIVEAH